MDESTNQESNNKSVCEPEKLEDVVTHILEEARMILPGIQALLGFQLIAVFNGSFKTSLSPLEQYFHLFAIFFSITAICLLMTPAIVHRLCEPETLSEKFAQLSSKLVASAMLPLLLSFCLEVFVVTRLVSDDLIISTLAAALVAAELVFFWFILPAIYRKQDKQRRAI